MRPAVYIRFPIWDVIYRCRMGRVRKKKESKATRINRMALVPLSEKSASSLHQRVLEHSKMMQDLMKRNLNFKNIPPMVLAGIVRDFQAAGMQVPAKALIASAKYQQPQPAAKYRPAPIFPDPRPTTEWLRGGTLPTAPSNARSIPTMMDLGIDPKTGYSVTSRAPALGLSYNPVSNKRAFAGSALPYTHVKRYAVDNLLRGSAGWRPPWMLYGDQPNQFVKTPMRASSMGRGPAGPNAPVGVGLSLPPPTPPPRSDVKNRYQVTGEQALYDGSPVPGRPIPSATGRTPPRTPARSPGVDAAPATPKRSTPPKTPKRSTPPKPPKRSPKPSPATPPPTPSNNSPRLSPIKPFATPKAKAPPKKSPQLDVTIIGPSPKDQLLTQIRSRAGRVVKPVKHYSPSDDAVKGKGRPAKDDLFDLIKTSAAKRRLSVKDDDD